jgi:hypothetical protein
VARKKPVQTFAETVTFAYERETFRLLQFDPNRMEVTVLSLDTHARRTLPFAHLPKPVKQKIRPL